MTAHPKPIAGGSKHRQAENPQPTSHGAVAVFSIYELAERIFFSLSAADLFLAAWTSKATSGVFERSKAIHCKLLHGRDDSLTASEIQQGSLLVLADVYGFSSALGPYPKTGTLVFRRHKGVKIAAYLNDKTSEDWAVKLVSAANSQPKVMKFSRGGTARGSTYSLMLMYTDMSTKQIRMHLGMIQVRSLTRPTSR